MAGALSAVSEQDYKQLSLQPFTLTWINIGPDGASQVRRHGGEILRGVENQHISRVTWGRCGDGGEVSHSILAQHQPIVPQAEDTHGALTAPTPQRPAGKTHTQQLLGDAHTATGRRLETMDTQEQAGP